MKIKQATFIALIGCILGLLGHLFNFIYLNIQGISLGGSYYVGMVLSLTMQISLVVFFIILYKNQK